MPRHRVQRCGRWYWVLGEPLCACGCGVTFVLTSHHRTQKFATPGCASKLQSFRLEQAARMREVRHRTAELRQAQLFRDLADRVVARGTVRRSDLIAVLETAYQRGKHSVLTAQWRARKRGIAA